jgi:hypothetical protein
VKADFGFILKLRKPAAWGPPVILSATAASHVLHLPAPDLLLFAACCRAAPAPNASWLAARRRDSNQRCKHLSSSSSRHLPPRLSALSVYPVDELTVSPRAERRSCPRAGCAPPPVSRRSFASAFTTSSRQPSRSRVRFDRSRELLRRPASCFDHAGPMTFLSHRPPKTAASRRCRLCRLAERRRSPISFIPVSTNAHSAGHG